MELSGICRIFPHFAERVDLENTARLTESSITAEDEHNFDVMDKHVLDAFLAFKLEAEGVITKEDSLKLMFKSFRKVGANGPRHRGTLGRVVPFLAFANSPTRGGC